MAKAKAKGVKDKHGTVAPAPPAVRILGAVSMDVAHAIEDRTRRCHELAGLLHVALLELAHYAQREGCREVEDMAREAGTVLGGIGFPLVRVQPGTGTDSADQAAESGTVSTVLH